MTRHNPRLGIMGDPMQALLAFVWSGHMDGSLLDIGIFLLATFAGALIAGVTGFAFGLGVSAPVLLILPAAPDRDPGHRLRADCAGVCGLAPASRAQLGTAVAVHPGGGLRRPGRGPRARLG